MSETTIAIGIWDGVEELDFVGPYEVLTAWAQRGERPRRAGADGRRGRRMSSGARTASRSSPTRRGTESATSTSSRLPGGHSAARQPTSGSSRGSASSRTTGR